MSAAWLTPPVTLTGSRMSDCGEKTAEECAWYRQRWHFWCVKNHSKPLPNSINHSSLRSRYIADYVFALPTVAFFMSAIGVFIIAHFASAILLRQRNVQRVVIWRKTLAATRYLSYRGFHVRAFRWNSAPVGILLLGAAGTIFFLCQFYTTCLSLRYID